MLFSIRNAEWSKRTCCDWLVRLNASSCIGKNTLPIKKVIIYILLGFLGLLALDLVFDMRGVGVSDFFSNLGYYIGKALQNNIILETIGSFGETIFTPYLVLCDYGVKFSPWFGECFVKSIVSIVPDLFGWFTDINNQAIFQKCYVLTIL